MGAEDTGFDKALNVSDWISREVCRGLSGGAVFLCFEREKFMREWRRALAVERGMAEVK
jgi:hypothetical protein